MRYQITYVYQYEDGSIKKHTLKDFEMDKKFKRWINLTMIHPIKFDEEPAWNILVRGMLLIEPQNAE